MHEGYSPRDRLLEGERGKPIARDLKSLREETYAFPARSEDLDELHIPEYEFIKPEVYAISAYIIEQVHTSTLKKIESSGDEHTVYSDLRFPFNPEKSRILPTNFAEIQPINVFRQMNDIGYIYPSAFIEELHAWSVEAKNNPNSFQAKARQRMSDLLIESDLNVRAQPRIGHEDAYPEAFIIRGAITASDVCWNTLRAIPIAYFEKYGKTIDPEEFRTIASTIEPLIILLSSLHLSTFSDINQFARAGSRTSRMLMAELPLELFELVEDAEGNPTSIQFSPTSLDALERYRSQQGRDVDEERRLGCPARDARVTDKDGKAESGIASMLEVHQRFAEDYLIPHLEAYVEGALEIATKPPDPLLFEA